MGYFQQDVEISVLLGVNHLGTKSARGISMPEDIMKTFDTLFPITAKVAGS